MSKARLDAWYTQLSYFYYVIFSLWTVIFLLYIGKQEYSLHYIAIFTQIGASVVASALLYSDKRLFRPIILVLMVPLIIYFAHIDEWYGYVLTIFSCILTWVLFYVANSSHRLLIKTRHQASHDQLTGLYNRHYFNDSLQQRMSSLHESGTYSYLLLIDLDHFKTINDSLGHDIGDDLLQVVAARLLADLPEDNILARLGGDEFIIIGNESDDRAQSEKNAKMLAETILGSLKDTYIIQGHHLYISASVGISLIDPSDKNANTFIKEADIAMYEVKATGRDDVYLFSEEMSRRVEHNLEIERLLHFAMDKNEFLLYFQPQLNHRQEIIGAETLVRWNNEKLGLVSPDNFIPIAEQTGLIVELGNYILNNAFRTLQQWHKQGVKLKQFSVNISVRQFVHHSFIQVVTESYRQHGIADIPCRVIFEITETVVAEDIQRVISIMQELRKLDIYFSMDDFGTGYSSLGYLKTLPIDEIKIDRSFICELEKDSGDQQMIITILNIAEIFDLSVVAEGVETPDQFNFLLSHSCDYYQGYYFSKPLPQEEFRQFYLHYSEPGSEK